jgi:hypothetical protein
VRGDDHFSAVHLLLVVEVKKIFADFHQVKYDTLFCDNAAF